MKWSKNIEHKKIQKSLYNLWFRRRKKQVADTVFDSHESYKDCSRNIK